MSTQFKLSRTNLLFVVVLLLAAVGLSYFITTQRLSAFESIVTTQLTEQQASLLALAEVTGRNASDPVMQTLLQDCPVTDRVEFDTLLGRLDQGLTTQELLTVDQLFGSCAHFQSERKAVLVARLDREVALLASYIDQLHTITTFNQAEQWQLGTWQELVEQEQAQSASIKALVEAQKSIIDTLLAGNTANSPAMVVILDDVKETQEALLFATNRAVSLRTQLAAE